LQLNEFATLAHQVFGESFPSLCATVGFKVAETFKPHQPLYDAVFHLTETEAQPSSPQTTVLFRSAHVQNVDEIWNT